MEWAQRGQSTLGLAKAMAALLQTWNRSFYQYRPFKEQHLLELEVLLDFVPRTISLATGSGV